MRFLIVGLGSIGRRHLRNLRALGETDILLYRTHRATLPDDDLEGLPVYTDLAEALAEKPQGVIIANPTAAHLSTALPAARAGANLLIEKPVSHTLEGLEQLREALSQNNCRAIVGFHFRYHPVLGEIRSLLAEGSLGWALSGRAHWGEYLPGWHPWEDYRVSYAARADLGGGVTNTLSHPFDYLRWMLGEIVSVSAELSKLSDLELDVEDNTEALLEFANGARVAVHLDYYQQPPSHTLELTCERGRILWDNADGSACVLFADGQANRQIIPPKGFERNDMFLAEMADFIRLCRGGHFEYCSLEDGIRVQQIVAAVRQSHAQKGLRVSLA
ncbi:MAG: Gfo/Idh/MocA family oxidoreductase [Chloroflexi bacterium]|jgi:predicted dehydrogenase|nr:Gfo/Idh/MocA family oxidoreductase [Anaerolineaceae bacterium]NLI45247.1 Gfo/Idh/MocA family oxidoreductase [Chloroflexota bacterium]